MRAGSLGEWRRDAGSFGESRRDAGSLGERRVGRGGSIDDGAAAEEDGTSDGPEVFGVRDCPDPDSPLLRWSNCTSIDCAGLSDGIADALSCVAGASLRPRDVRDDRLSEVGESGESGAVGVSGRRVDDARDCLLDGGEEASSGTPPMSSGGLDGRVAMMMGDERRVEAG